MTFVLLCGAVSSVLAQDNVTITLTIIDKNDKLPVAGAACLVTNHGIYGVTNGEGVVKLENVPYDKIDLEVRMLSYTTFKKSFTVAGNYTENILLEQESLELEQVLVVAKASAAGTSTSSQIGRQAIDHLQATSLKDIMQLLPGQLMSNSDMTSVEKITIRTLNSSTANNSFGTAILVDGIPMSDNATRDDKTGVNVTGNSGVDLRQIGADNIESVEVIRGIPSAEYGDLTSGAVIVNTKAGYTPLTVRAKINPTTFNTSLGKGWRFDNNGGSFNANFDYANAWGDPRNKSQAFDRISGGLVYGNTFWNIWTTDTKVSATRILDLRETDPDMVIQGRETTQENMSLRLSHSGKIALNKLFSRTLSYSIGYSTSVNNSTTKSIVSADGGTPIINALGSGYYVVPYVTDSYWASGGTNSSPSSIFLKLSNTFSVNYKNTQQRFNMGVEYRNERNDGEGFYNDDDDLPLRPNSDGRPLPYYRYPAITQMSAYIEDNFSWDITEVMKFKVQAGVRFTSLQPTQPEQVFSVSPRFNGSLKITEWLDIRGGWGLNSKTPGLSHLYPDPKYMDREVARYLPNEVANQLVMYQTYVTEVERNNMLKNATNSRSELGVDVSLGNGMNFSVVGYRDCMKNGFGNYTEYQTYLSNYYTAEKGIIVMPNGSATIDWDNPARVDTVFTTTGRIGNTASTLDRGIEFDINFGKIKPINTTIYLSGAYMETQTWSSGPNTSSPSGIPANSVYAQGGANTSPFKLVYPSGTSRDINRRFSTVIRAVCNIPRMKMVASLSGQIIWYTWQYTTNQSYSPYGWIDTDLSYHEITPEMLADPNYTIKGILLSDQIRNPSDDVPASSKPIWIINARLTKDISKSLGFSFYANNALFYMPYQSSNTSGTLTERNTGTFAFGMELHVKL